MTTIALRKYSNLIELAADNQYTAQEIRETDSTVKFGKIHQLWPTCWAASGGSLACWALFSKIAKSWPEKPKTVDDLSDFLSQAFQLLDNKPGLARENFSLTLIFEGEAYEILNNIVPVPILEFSAIGTGRNLALGALTAGASAQEAVEIAIQYDIWSGGEVDVVRVAIES